MRKHFENKNKKRIDREESNKKHNKPYSRKEKYRG